MILLSYTVTMHSWLYSRNIVQNTAFLYSYKCLPQSQASAYKKDISSIDTMGVWDEWHFSKVTSLAYYTGSHIVSIPKPEQIKLFVCYEIPITSHGVQDG